MLKALISNAIPYDNGIMYSELNHSLYDFKFSDVNVHFIGRSINFRAC